MFPPIIDTHIDGLVNFKTVTDLYQYIDELSKQYRLVVISTTKPREIKLIDSVIDSLDDRHKFLQSFKQSNGFGINGVVKATFSAELRDISYMNFPDEFTAILVGELNIIRRMFSGYSTNKLRINIPTDNGMFETYLGLLREAAGNKPIFTFNIYDTNDARAWWKPDDDADS